MSKLIQFPFDQTYPHKKIKIKQWNKIGGIVTAPLVILRFHTVIGFPQSFEKKF